jgi:hypothetical protein
MHNTYAQHLDQIEGQVLEIKEALWDKPDREDLEHLQNEVVAKLEEIRDDNRKLKDEPEAGWGFGGENFGLT